MIQRHFGFLKTTALGGMLFLLPVLVIAVLVGQVAPLIVQVIEAVVGRLPLHTPAGIALLVGLSLVLLVLICFLAGLAARVSIGRRLGHWLERQLIAFFPRYAIIRNQLADRVGSEPGGVQLKPVLIRWNEHRQLGFETDRANGWCAVYLPGAPDTWAGKVVFVDSQRITPLQMEFSQAVSLCERLGTETLSELAKAEGLPSDLPTNISPPTPPAVG